MKHEIRIRRRRYGGWWSGRRHMSCSALGAGAGFRELRTASAVYFVASTDPVKGAARIQLHGMSDVLYRGRVEAVTFDCAQWLRGVLNLAGKPEDAPLWTWYEYEE